MEMYIGIDIQVKISSQLAYNHAFTAILWPKIENSGLPSFRWLACIVDSTVG